MKPENKLVSIMLTAEENAYLEDIASYHSQSVAQIARGFLRLGIKKHKAKENQDSSILIVIKEGGISASQ